MGQDIVSQLKRIDWFKELPEDLLITLANKVNQRMLSKDETLFNKGDVGDSLFIILSGEVKVVTQDEDGNEIALNKVGAGEIIGEMSLLDHEPRSAGIVALEKTITLELKREDFMEIMNSQPNLALAVIRNLSARLRHNTSYIEQITDMSRHVAIGDYSFISRTEPILEQNDSALEQDKIGQLMAEFIAMVQGVQEREEELKKQVQKLALQIDEPKRKKDFEEIINADFYATIKNQAKTLRAQREDKK
jgi:CRP-like cAMP-binding protein